MSSTDREIESQKTKTARVVHVKAHDRTIYLRRFKFICGYCNEAVTRETYAPICPKYGNQCQGKTSKCRRFGGKKK